MFQAGDRVRLITMGADPHPIAPGSTGTVTRFVDFGDWAQVSVNWDTGRTLMVCLPDDQIIKDESRGPSGSETFYQKGGGKCLRLV